VSSEVLVLVPAASAASQSLPEGTPVVAYSNAVDVFVALRGSAGPVVLDSDGLGDDTLAAVAAALRERSGPCIEVRARAWDGESHSPVSAACRGVISGFGVAGIRAALALLLEEQAASQSRPH
jgi:3-dehydroquinate dehydratase